MEEIDRVLERYTPMKLGLIYKYGKLFPLFVVKSKKVGVILILSECMARWARLIFL